MWFSGNQPETKTNIEEANRHLNALMSKITELENEVIKKDEELKEKDIYLQTLLSDFREKREAELQETAEKLFQQNLRIDRLERDLSSRETEMTSLRQRGRMLDELIRYKATLAKLTITLEQAEQYTHLTRLRSGPSNGYSNAGGDFGIHVDPAPLPALANHCADDTTSMASASVKGTRLIDQASRVYLTSLQAEPSSATDNAALPPIMNTSLINRELRFNQGSTKSGRKEDID